MTKNKLFMMSALVLLMIFIINKIFITSCTVNNDSPKDSNQRSETSTGEHQLAVVHFVDGTVLVDYVSKQSEKSINVITPTIFTIINSSYYYYVKSVDFYQKYPPNIETGYYTLDYYSATLQQDILNYNKNSLNIDTSQNNNDSSDTILIDPDDKWLRASQIRNIDLINHNESTARPLLL